MAVVPLTKNREIFYPESDGRPMAESDLHRDEMVYELVGRMQEAEERAAREEAARRALEEELAHLRAQLAKEKENAG